jgi:hypothetical protein
MEWSPVPPQRSMSMQDACVVLLKRRSWSSRFKVNTRNFHLYLPFNRIFTAPERTARAIRHSPSLKIILAKAWASPD